MTITIQVESQQVTAALNELARRTQHLQPAFHDIGETLKTHIADCFKHEKSPNGVNWKALSPSTLRQKHKKRESF